MSFDSLQSYYNLQNQLDSGIGGIQQKVDLSNLSDKKEQVEDAMNSVLSKGQSIYSQLDLKGDEFEKIGSTIEGSTLGVKTLKDAGTKIFKKLKDKKAEIEEKLKGKKGSDADDDLIEGDDSITDSLTGKAGDISDELTSKASQLSDTLTSKASQLTDTLTSKASQFQEMAVDKIDSVMRNLGQRADGAVDDISNAISDNFSKLKTGVSKVIDTAKGRISNSETFNDPTSRYNEIGQEGKSTSIQQNELGGNQRLQGQGSEAPQAKGTGDVELKDFKQEYDMAGGRGTEMKDMSSSAADKPDDLGESLKDLSDRTQSLQTDDRGASYEMKDMSGADRTGTDFGESLDDLSSRTKALQPSGGGETTAIDETIDDTIADAATDAATETALGAANGLLDWIPFVGEGVMLVSGLVTAGIGIKDAVQGANLQEQTQAKANQVGQSVSNSFQYKAPSFGGHYVVPVNDNLHNMADHFQGF